MTLENIPLATRPTNRRTGQGNAITTPGVAIDDEFTAAELEFLKAMDKWRTEHRGRFPTCADVVAVLKSLGYIKSEANLASN